MSFRISFRSVRDITDHFATMILWVEVANWLNVYVPLQTSVGPLLVDFLGVADRTRFYERFCHIRPLCLSHEQSKS